MFRHVVMFEWEPRSTDGERSAAAGALRKLAHDVSDLGILVVGTDAGLSEGNFDVVVVADFPDRETYLRYAHDPRHLDVVNTYIRPHLRTRAAVQTEMTS